MPNMWILPVTTVAYVQSFVKVLLVLGTIWIDIIRRKVYHLLEFIFINRSKPGRNYQK